MAATSPCYFTARPDNKCVVSYEITNKCNLNCQHCMNKSTKDAFAGLDFNKIKVLLQELWDNDVRYLYISGGEPLLHPQFDEIITTAHNIGFQMMLATNSIEVPNHIDTIKNAVSDISISLDGIGSTHDKLRGVEGAFDNVMSAIDLLNKNNIYTRISTCLWKGNLDQIEDIANLAEQKNLKKINFSILVPTGRSVENDVLLNWDDYPKLIERIDQLKKKYDERKTVDIVLRRNKLLNKDSIDCFGGESIFHIDAHGRVSPCSWCSKADIGNRFSMQWRKGNLTECINKVKELHALVQARKLKYGYSGCPAIAYFQNGDMMNEDPLNLMICGVMNNE